MALQKKMAGSRKSKKLKLRMINGFKNKKKQESKDIPKTISKKQKNRL